MTSHGRCRACGAVLSQPFADLGYSPISNAVRPADQLGVVEKYYPLRTFVCGNCKLVQTEDFIRPEDLFASNYAYFSSYSTTWLRHAESYAGAMCERLGLGPHDLVVEAASNDGYLLQYFKERGISVLGIEPAANVAAAAREKGIDCLECFLNPVTARRVVETRQPARLVIANNVLAHVPDINEFVAGLKLLLGQDGVLTVEFPHLLNLIKCGQFDTIYHEHYSYLSLAAVERILEPHGLSAFDVDELPTHGGSLRVFVQHVRAARPVGEGLLRIRKVEADEGLDRLETYGTFAERVKTTKRRLLSFLIAAKDSGKTVAGYGAPAKATTLLNYCGIGRDFIDYTVDISPHKQGHYIPGTFIPILAPGHIRETRPDYLIIFPWNIQDEILEATAYIRDWGGKWVVPVPSVEVMS